MKKQTFLKMTAALAFSFFTHLQSTAQGNFDFTNNTPNTLFVEAWADYDDCAGNYLCNSGMVMVPPGGMYTFNTCTANGAWKYFVAGDGCGKSVVGVCGFPLTDTFTDCNVSTVTLNWIDEHTGSAN